MGGGHFRCVRCDEFLPCVRSHVLEARHLHGIRLEIFPDVAISSESRSRIAVNAAAHED